MVRKIAIVLIVLTLFALLGLGYLQFTSETAYVAAGAIRQGQKISDENVTEINFAKLRDKKAAELIIKSKEDIVGKYAMSDIAADTIFTQNGTLSDSPPPGRCFSTGRCLPEGYTAWIFTGTEADTLGGTVQADDLLDIMLVDVARKQVTTMVQKVKPLEILNGNVFIFAFTPEQAAILNGITGTSTEETTEGNNLYLALQLNQSPNPPLALLQRYTMDYTAIRADLFPLPQETPTPTEEK